MQSSDPDKKYLELAEKWLNSTITPEEEIEFSNWYIANQDGEVLLPSSFAENEAALKDKIFLHIQKRKQETVREISVYRPLLVRVAAAAIFILVSASLVFYFTRGNTTQSDVAAKQRMNDVSPGGNKAVLTLADGSEIILDNAVNGTLTQQGNTKVLKLDAGQLSYLISGSKANGKVFYNTISTPRGGQYQIILPDGSKVWLNAASSLRFPTAFIEKQRNVELTGEAYFEVAKNAAVPFKVAVNGMNVEVLGTHFNINSYNDEASIKTTLLEGAVKVVKGNIVAMLSPGQQAALDPSGQVIVNKNVDVDEMIAWKNGTFNFNSLDITGIMRQISRWYDADISYVGKLSKETFSGIVNRNCNISQVLKIMEHAGIKFRIEGKKISVLQ